MARCLVCLTFDFDAISSLVRRGQTTPTALSRGEFGVVGAERILDLLKQRRITATWFVPGHTLDTYPEISRRIHAEGHEIAHHGYLHEPPATLTRDDEERVLVRGLEAIKRITGGAPRGYRSPAWDLSPHSIELLLKHGIQYDSSLMGHDYDCYYARQGDVAELKKPFVRGRETRLVEMPISWSLDDYPHFEYMRLPNGSVMLGLMNATNVLENFVDDYTYMTRVQPDFGILTYTFHPHVIGRGHRMMMLERLIRKLAAAGAVFMTMEAAMAEWLARQQAKVAAE